MKSLRNHRSRRTIRKRNVKRSYSLTINEFVRGKSSKISSSYCVICSMRISFTILLIASIILLLISSIFFALDMFLQSSCHLIHHKQHFLISYLTGKTKLSLKNLKDFLFRKFIEIDRWIWCKFNVDFFDWRLLKWKTF